MRTQAKGSRGVFMSRESVGQNAWSEAMQQTLNQMMAAGTAAS
jgi:hypothetical protein